jgi:hypothetical protein
MRRVCVETARRLVRFLLIIMHFMKALALPTIALLTLAAAPKAHAQFGVKGGLNFAELQGRSGEDATYKTFYHVGILYQWNLLGPIAIQPELQYSLQGSNLKGAFTDYKTKLHYFTVPVLAKVTVGPIFVEAGPQFGYLVSANQSGQVQITNTNGSAGYGQVDQEATDQYKRPILAWRLARASSLARSRWVGATWRVSMTLTTPRT